MKKLVDYIEQSRPYADSYGECVIELEDGDNEEEIIAQFTQDRPWYAIQYTDPIHITRYEEKLWNGNVKTYYGNLIHFKTYRTYLD